MKKFLCILSALVILTGCGNMDNTPTKKVEALLNEYQMADDNVMNDLDTVLMGDASLNDDDRSSYREFMKKHYQDLKYEIKDEKIDGDTATVEASITVKSYKQALTDADTYRNENSDKFDDKNTFASYRLQQLEKVSDTETYTIYFHLTKVDDQWSIDPLSDDDLDKLNGSYGFTSSSNLNSSTTNDNTLETDDSSDDNDDSSKDEADDSLKDEDKNS